MKPFVRRHSWAIYCSTNKSNLTPNDFSMNVLIVGVFSWRDSLSNSESFTHVGFCANSRSRKYSFHRDSRPIGPDAILLEPTFNESPLILEQAVRGVQSEVVVCFPATWSRLKIEPPTGFPSGFLPPPPVPTRNLSKHLVGWNVLEPGGETLPAAGLLSNRSAWPSASQRRDELKHKASINIKVHRPHRAAKEHTVNLASASQTALNATHAMALRL